MYQIQKKIPPKFARILKMVYGLPASITIVTGRWKEGKTDFSLLLSECCQELGIIHSIGSNIETGDPRVKFIKGFPSLKAWFFGDRSRKIFLYDEVTESSPRRRAMSSLNVEWVKTIPQLSKAKGHLVAICQETALTESAFFNPTFCRGIWRKLGVKNAVFNSPLLRGENYIVQGLPPTSINFDPYLLATFQLEESSMLLDPLPFPLKAMSLYAKGMSFEKIGYKLGLKQATQVRRLIQKGCKIFLTYLQQPSEGKKLLETSKELDKENV